MSLTISVSLGFSVFVPVSLYVCHCIFLHLCVSVRRSVSVAFVAYICVLYCWLVCCVCHRVPCMSIFSSLHTHHTPSPPPPKHTTQQVFMHNLVINLPHFCNICGAAMRTQLAARKHHDAAKRRRKGVIWIT